MERRSVLKGIAASIAGLFVTRTSSYAGGTKPPVPFSYDGGSPPAEVVPIEEPVFEVLGEVEPEPPHHAPSRTLTPEEFWKQKPYEVTAQILTPPDAVPSGTARDDYAAMLGDCKPRHVNLSLPTQNPDKIELLAGGVLAMGLGNRTNPVNKAYLLKAQEDYLNKMEKLIAGGWRPPMPRNDGYV